jgi:hypothetical protein
VRAQGIRIDADPRNVNAEQNMSARVFSWLIQRPFAVAFVVGAVAMAILVLPKGMTEFEWAYVFSARNLLAGRGLYQLKVRPFRAYTYPPFMAMLSIPFALMPSVVERVSWFLVNVACFAFIWRGTWKLIGGGKIQFTRGRAVNIGQHIVALVGLGCALPYLQSALAHQQTDLLIIALVTGACVCLLRGCDTRAAICLGVATGMKCTPLLWAPYLAWKGRWKAAALIPLVAVGVNLLPELCSPAHNGLWLGAWIDQFLRPMGQVDYLPGRWFAWILDNQSLAGTLGRWATTACVPGRGELVIVARAGAWSARSVRPIVFGVEAALVLIAWIALERGRARARRSPRQPTSLHAPTEFSVVMLLMVLLSPMSSRPHFGITLLPALNLARIAVHDGRRRLFIPLCVTGLTVALALPIWGPSIGRLTMWCGVITLGTVSLLLGCLSVLAMPGDAHYENAGERASRSASRASSMRPHWGKLRSPRGTRLVNLESASRDIDAANRPTA